VEEAGSTEAATLLATDDELVASELLLLELTSVIWQKARREELMSEHAGRAVARAPTLFGRLFPIGPLVPAALAIATTIDHSVRRPLPRARPIAVSAAGDRRRAPDRVVPRHAIRRDGGATIATRPTSPSAKPKRSR